MLKYDDGTEKEMKLMKTPRAGDSDEDTCTSMSYTNERNDQMTKCKCRWNMMAQAVTNCNMPAGVICQHKDFASSTIIDGFLRISKKKQFHLKKNIPFGFCIFRVMFA